MTKQENIRPNVDATAAMGMVTLALERKKAKVSEADRLSAQVAQTKADLEGQPSSFGHVNPGSQDIFRHKA